MHLTNVRAAVCGPFIAGKFLHIVRDRLGNDQYHIRGIRNPSPMRSTNKIELGSIVMQRTSDTVLYFDIVFA